MSQTLPFTVPTCSNRETTRVLVVSAPRSPLATWVEALLTRHGVACQTSSVLEAEAALSKANPTFDYAALVQDRPAVLPADLPERITAAATANIKLLSVAGSWCEGELRTGKPWPKVERVYWHGLEAWLRAELVSSDTLADREAAPRLVAIDAVDAESASAIADELATEGVASVWLPRFGPRPRCTGVNTGLWIGGQLNGFRARQLADFASRLRPSGAPCVALLDFPRPDEAKLATDLGVAAVLGKPWSNASLLDVLRRVNRREEIVHLGLPLLLPAQAA